MVSEDGVELFPGDRVFAVDIQDESILKYTIINSNCINGSLVYFSTMEAAEAYFELIKPKYSYSVIERIYKEWRRQKLSKEGITFLKYLRKF